MARIEIQDDWGKPTHIIEIVSADTNGLYESVVSSLDYRRCVCCQKFASESDSVIVDSEEMEYSCRQCFTDKR